MTAPRELRSLIVNADDFGRSAGVNRGIVEAHCHGIVTSASLMVRWPAAVEAVALARQATKLSVGLHVDLGEWSLQEGVWVSLYEVARLDDAESVEREIRHQLERFRELTGCNPTHLDSHQHVHRSEPVRSMMLALADELSVPLRHFAPYIHHCGAFYGQTAQGESRPQALSADALLELLSGLPAGISELGCHPALDDDLDTMYRRERLIEMDTLCNLFVQQEIHRLGIELISFPTAKKPQHETCRQAVPMAGLQQGGQAL